MPSPMPSLLRDAAFAAVLLLLAVTTAACAGAVAEEEEARQRTSAIVDEDDTREERACSAQGKWYLETDDGFVCREPLSNAELCALKRGEWVRDGDVFYCARTCPWYQINCVPRSLETPPQ